MATEVNLPFLAINPKDNQPVHFKMTFTRAKFNDLIKSLVNRSIRITEEAIKDAKLTIQDIKDILLVGGSTRVPLVKEELKKLIGKDFK
ncbi:hypothetical protein AB836_00775 [Rickettsiales bacterium (ex Bugula neritina AB1)]|nr:hypothetical protein AB836_00775 [Rickettsiales bacterium (ex Bugula neritina AB1)]